jgi:hypothetical protein
MATISPVTVLIKYLSQRDNQFIQPASLFELKRPLHWGWHSTDSILHKFQLGG